MQPPQTINVLDQHGGFTAKTKSWTREREGLGWRKALKESDTVWRPGEKLRRTTIGELDTFEEHSFYQTNNDVTLAYYKVPGYRFRVCVWFDNSSGQRIA